MSENTKLINKIYRKVFLQEISRMGIHDLLDEFKLREVIFDEIVKLPFYTLDGRLDNVLDSLIYQKGIKQLIEFGNFEDFINLLKEELKNIYVPNILIFPLNIIRKSSGFEMVDFKNDNIKIFPTYKGTNIFLRKKSKIEDYVEKNVYLKFLPDHIKITKDAMFFNYPLMTILFNGIDDNIVRESPKIIEAVSSIIRMVCFKKSKAFERKELISSAPLGTTFAVYYNLPRTSPNPPYNNGYGYSHRTSFYNFLDVSIDDIKEHNEIISETTTRLIDILFRADNNGNVGLSSNEDKWINSLFIFNEAYELASRENYDAANIMLLTILESLFLPSDAWKSKKNRLSEILKEKVPTQFNKEFVEKLIITTYDMRNAFVHRGSRIKRVGRFELNISSLIGGYEPLINIRNAFGRENTKLEYLNSLFILVIFCILNYEKTA